MNLPPRPRKEDVIRTWVKDGHRVYQHPTCGRWSVWLDYERHPPARLKCNNCQATLPVKPKEGT